MATLIALAVALGECSDHELADLRDAINHLPDCPPGLIAWIEHATGWEVHRRAGHRRYPLQAPRAAIDDTEVAASLTALTRLAALAPERNGPVARFLGITTAMLLADTGSGKPH